MFTEFNKFYQELYSKGGPEAVRDGFPQIGVDVRDYPDHQMFLLDYNQITATDNHPVSDLCRGLLVKYDGTIVRKGFTRFYNFGQAGHDTFDFANAVVLEKCDGSMCPIYFCPATNKWEIGTRGTAFAEGPNEWHGTFRQAMLKAMGRTEEEFQRDASRFDKNVTRVYEYLSPDNQIVTPYEKDELVALAYISNITGEEVIAPGAAIERGMGWQVRQVREYKFSSQEDCLRALEELKNLEEGYVAYDPKTKERVKLKNKVYLNAHRLRGNGLTLNSVCELVAMNEYAEYLAVFDKDAPKFESAIKEYAEMQCQLKLTYDKYKDIESQKDFALSVKDLELSCVLFTARKLKSDITTAFNSYDVNKRADWLKERLIALKQAEDTVDVVSNIINVPM
jgi:hypothetical protein